MRLGSLKSKENVAIVALLVLTLSLTVLIIVNKAIPEEPRVGFIEFSGHRLHDRAITRGDIFGCLFGLTIAACYITALMVCQNKLANEGVIDHIFYVILLAAASVSCAVTFYQHAVVREKYFDVGDMFHYYLGPKYLKETGYEELYICAAVAQRESGRELPRYIRSLRTNEMSATTNVLTGSVAARARARFSVERWQAFKEDVDTFRQWHGPTGWQRRFSDHGYNGTPGWNFFASLVTNYVPINRLNLTLVAMLNMYLVMVMFVVVLKAFGWRLGLLFTILFCSNFPDRFLLGGALLRYFWVASLIIGLSCMKMRKYGWAGLLIGLSAMLIVFPMFFLFGIVLKTARSCSRQMRIPKEHRRFLCAAAVTCMAVFALSISVGQGLGNWTGFGRQMKLNSGRLASGRIGFVYNFIHPKEVLEEEGQQPYEPRLASYKRARLLYFSWENLATVFVAASVLLMARLAGRLDDLCLTTLLGFALLFLLFSTVRYYYAGLVGLPLMWHSRMQKRSGRVFVLILFLIMVMAYYFSTRTIYCFVYNTWLSGAFTCYIVAAIAYLYAARRGTCGPGPRLSPTALDPAGQLQCEHSISSHA